jgi:hypothetical protein
VAYLYRTYIFGNVQCSYTFYFTDCDNKRSGVPTQASHHAFLQRRLPFATLYASVLLQVPVTLLERTMRLLRRSDDGSFSLTIDYDYEDDVPPYAILSHTWGADAEEVSFEDLANGEGETKLGYEKIRFCGEQAQQDGLQHFWIDTCCINKANEAELSHAINSMFRWYRNATRCYVYLSDVSCPFPKPGQEEVDATSWDQDFRRSKWFTRGWALQELLAPGLVEFFSRDQKKLGDKISLKQRVHEITGIHISALEGTPLAQFSVNERLLWSKSRTTTIKEDKAYSLLGIFDVYVSLFYGEGISGAFKRLMAEISKLERCIQDIRSTSTDPRDDKKRFEGMKGGLVYNAVRFSTRSI